MPGMNDVHHQILLVADLERSERFYGDTVGLKPMGRDLWPEDGPTTTFQLDSGQYLVLVQVSEVPPAAHGVHTNMDISTEDFRALRERLEESGVRIRRAEARASRRAVGEISATFYDPDGNQLQMAAYSERVEQVPAAMRGKVVAGSIDDFAIGSVTYIRAGQFFLLRLAEGVQAISRVCTHMQCTIVYQPEHYQFYCPCHDNTFTRKGEHIGHDFGVPPLHTYPIEFIDGKIVVDTDTSVARTPEEAEHLVPAPAPESAR